MDTNYKTKVPQKVGLLLLLLLMAGYVYGGTTTNILEFGGKGDGVTDNSQVIKDVIKKASLQGGGTIYFPPGDYLTGPIILESNITIHIAAGATLVFSDDFDKYIPFVKMRWEGTVMKSFCPLFYAINKQNITITGRGKINGQGYKWWEAFKRIYDEVNKDGQASERNKWQQLWDEQNPDLEVSENYRHVISMKFFRPPLFQTFRCNNILIEGVTIINSPFWTLNPEFCENVTIRSVTIINPISPNTDGINPESCMNVHISDCHISVGDDCITIKSGRDQDGRNYNVPCENITITNCTMVKGHGGVVIGSEMSGGVKDVVISNCVFDGTDRGIRIKSMRGRGGVVENIRVSNISMSNIHMEAFRFNMEYQETKYEPLSERTPQFRDIHISNVSGSNVAKVCTIKGLPEMPVESISLTNIQLEAEEGLEVNTAHDVTLDNVTIDVQKGKPFSFSNTSILNLQNIRSKPVGRETPLINLINCNNVFIANCFPYPGTGIFLYVEGDESGNIMLANNNLRNVTQKIWEGAGVKKGAIIENK